MSGANNTVGKYIDAKADYARKMAVDNVTETTFYNHLALCLDNLADEIRMGLHEMNVDSPVAM